MTLNFNEGLMKLAKVVTTNMVEDNDIICSPVDTDEDPFATFVCLMWWELWEKGGSSVHEAEVSKVPHVLEIDAGGRRLAAYVFWSDIVFVVCQRGDARAVRSREMSAIYRRAKAKLSLSTLVRVWSEDKIPGFFVSIHDINVWLPECSLVS